MRCADGGTGARKKIVREHATRLSSDALSSSTASLKFGPRSWWARHSTLVVLPVPGGPCGYEPIMPLDATVHEQVLPMTHGENQVWHVALFCDHLQPRHGLMVADDILYQRRPILLHLKSTVVVVGGASNMADRNNGLTHGSSKELVTFGLSISMALILTG